MRKKRIDAIGATAKGRVVLVGTYRGDQLTKWSGWYNYPISDGDFLAAKNAKGAKNGRAVSMRPPKHPKFTFIDLFAGIGGFHLAMHKLGGKCVFASEWRKCA